MKRTMYILGGIALTIIFLVGINKLRYKAPLPAKFKDYKYLSEGSIESDNYEIVKIFDGWKGRAEINGIVYLKNVFYDTVAKSIVFNTYYKAYEQRGGKLYGKEPYQTFWKMNNQGSVIDSIKIDYSLVLDNSGIFFHNDYYIDWVNSGNKAKQAYVKAINGDNLSTQQIESFIERADRIAVNKDYDSQSTNIFCKTNEGWIRIKSKSLYEKTVKVVGTIVLVHTLSPYIKSYQERFIELALASDNLIETEYFIKESKSSVSFGDFNNHGRSGWEGTGYFKLTHNSESINFKSYAFNNGLDKAYIYCPIEKSHDFIILYLYKRSNDDRDFRDTGLYVLRRK